MVVVGELVDDEFGGKFLVDVDDCGVAPTAVCLGRSGTE